MTQCTQVATEEWRPVVGWEGCYEVSDHGRVKRVKAAAGATPGKILKQKLSKWGYPAVTLSQSQKKKTPRIHCLMMEAFRGKRPENHDINHIDGVKTNNKLYNLEYVTASRNLLHAYDLGLKIAPKTKLTKEQVEEVLRNLHISGADFGRRFGVHRNAIYDIRKRKSWSRLNLP